MKDLIYSKVYVSIMHEDIFDIFKIEILKLRKITQIIKNLMEYMNKKI
jgi:hypothetical protein